ncbi:uncharacterized protein SETTUDRAFT_27641 [Exserohilum turcica Et28A]|uniref:Uncharacterized protein n=1 Tax=Exserohilum turcicum (strain 28A) TaxID=671987 RepID=R0KJM9_EXST2|nr:uncharacterized protein SETTUDRAFT_27641 [Exserohilum turcica Et28A]EOA88187.1 hypothetical protein SETTUDRAFT_27641 [Exserohilum turcica Et28A]
MVRLLSIATGFLALFTAAEACSGWYQCKNSDGSHCCVVDSSSGPDSCPQYCSGGADWPPECIGQITGNSRHPCVTSSSIYLIEYKLTEFL